MFHQFSSRIQNLPPTSDTSSPSSSRTTSPSLSPTSQHLPHHLNNLSYHPHSTHTNSETDDTRNKSGATQCSHSVLPCAVLRGRSSLRILRHRPSAVDMVLNEERSRCHGDAIERAGLDLMEPRPIDMKSHTQRSCSIGAERRDSRGMPVHEPRFVMGGIFEVMEGRA
ncbi:hypothetical protein PENDEC_c028G04434 [Penicillium decumbens]|uniref:Uncharacterized protein n=1 Tax=Penicillium decumbens TaxID=69771 RepID=A0A1V6NZZ1_PENDC|nr:hypothetical protein PENDEC_c028G04434 [Penicillium decumbens]